MLQLACYFLKFHICPNLQSNFCYYRHLKRFKMILRISKVFGSKSGATEILTMISVQKCQVLAISEDWTNVHACCSFKLIINNECLVFIHSLDFALIIYVTKIRQFHISQFWNGTGPILPFLVLALFELTDYHTKPDWQADNQSLFHEKGHDLPSVHSLIGSRGQDSVHHCHHIHHNVQTRRRNWTDI